MKHNEQRASMSGLYRAMKHNEQRASMSTALTENQQRQKSVEDRLHRMKTLRSPPTEIYVLGERNSGTNFAAHVLRRAFVPPNVVDPSRTHEYFSADIPVLRHKHMFRHHILTQEELEEIKRRRDILWILAVRQPCAWAEAMKRIPWHLCYPLEHDECQRKKFIGMEHRSDTKQLSLSSFFGMQWADWPGVCHPRSFSVSFRRFRTLTRVAQRRTTFATYRLWARILFTKTSSN